MKTKLKEAIVLFFIQIVSYSLLCINYRAIALAFIGQAVMSDFLIASLNFYIIRKIAKSDDSFHQWVGYVLGSMVGSYVGIYLSLLLTK